MKKVSVVILNWNGSEMLRRFLPSVIEHSAQEGVEICIADNGSSDDSIEMLKKEFPSVRLVLLDKNYGFADGYNLSLKQIEADYFVLLNSDVEVSPGWLKPLIDYMDTHPEAAACQPKLKSWKNKSAFEYAGACGGFIDRYGYPYCRGRILNTVEEDTGQYDDIHALFWATGAALFIRTADYWNVGGLDGRFFAHMEEIDLCWRLRSRGRTLVCIPQSIVYHVGGATLQKENPHKTFLNFRNNLLMLYKNLPEQEFSSVMRTRAMLDYLAAFGFLLKGQLPNAKAVRRARKEFHRIKEEFEQDRKKNLEQTILHQIPERIKKSILRLYYLNRQRTWKNW